MSRTSPLRAGALTLLLSLVGLPGPIEAQQTEAELLARIEVLIPAAKEAREVANEAARRRNAEIIEAMNIPTTDTLRVGPLTVIALVEQADLARELFTEVLSEDFAGIESTESLDQSIFSFQWGDDLRPLGIAGSTYAIAEKRAVSRAVVKYRAREAVGLALSHDLLLLDTKLRRWSTERVREPTEQELRTMYRQLATIPSQTVRDCMKGAGEACWTSMGLDVGPDALDLWYTADDLRALVARRGREVFGVSEMDEVVNDCVWNGDPSVCHGIFEGPQFENARALDWVSPLRGTLRSTLVWVALQSGGPEAWSRLLEDPSMEPSRALQYASGLSADELSKEWRDLIIANRPPTQAGLGASHWIALFWFFFFAALALRSTRWRLG